MHIFFETRSVVIYYVFLIMSLTTRTVLSYRKMSSSCHDIYVQ